jgi:predicted alpha/beta superfamily hydrolase
MMMRLIFAAVIAGAVWVSGAVAAPVPPPAYALPGSAVHTLEGPDHRRYDLYVKTPPGYGRAESAAMRYPVIYVNDGDLFFAAAAGASLLPNYNGVIPPAIIVGISYARDEDPIASRQRDFTPTGDPSWPNETGGAPVYFDWMRSTAIAFVDDTYRTDQRRRALVGHSLGGTFVAYALFTQPELFSDYVLVSPALWFGEYAVGGIESRYAQAHDELPARIFLAVGDLEGPKGGLKAIDMSGDLSAFAQKLKSRHYRGLTVRDIVLDDVGHATSFTAAIGQALEWLFQEE